MPLCVRLTDVIGRDNRFLYSKLVDNCYKRTLYRGLLNVLFGDSYVTVVING